MNNVTMFFKRINCLKVSWWLAIGSDILYLISTIWCAIQYFQSGEGSNYSLDVLAYIAERQQHFYLFIIGYFLLGIANILVYTFYIMQKPKKLKVTMSICVFIPVVCAVLFLLDKALRGSMIFLLYFPLVITIYLSCAAVIVSIILLMIDREYRKVELLLLGSILFHIFGATIIVVLIVYIVLKLLLYFFFPPKEIRVIEKRDLDGNVLDRWTIEE